MANWTADYFKSYPLAEKPWQAITANDGRVVANNTHFDTYFVECGYPLSGGYNYAARFLYYALAALAIISWRKTWIATTLLASIMTYSATAAVHAVVLVSFRKRLVENPFEWISVDMSGDVILPAWPQAWDNDCDAVLAVIGVAILALIPLQIQSQIFSHPQPEVKAILLLWGMLLLMGFACALVNEEYVGAWNFPSCGFVPTDIVIHCRCPALAHMLLISRGTTPFGNSMAILRRIMPKPFAYIRASTLNGR